VDDLQGGVSGSWLKIKRSLRAMIINDHADHHPPPPYSQQGGHHYDGELRHRQKLTAPCSPDRELVPETTVRRNRINGLKFMI
jgi:hypothetical protein